VQTLLRNQSQHYFVDNNIGKAESLPADAFTDEEFLKLELNKLFPYCWQLVPRPSLQKIPTGKSDEEYFQTKGMQIPFTLYGNRFFLQRDETGDLHCFPNVCTHAWYPLVENPEIKRSIICPQHGRQFSLQGKFLSQAGFNHLENFPRDIDHLQNIALQEWNGFVFVCLDKPLAGFEQIIQHVASSMPGVKANLLRRTIVGTEMREVDGNWKQHAWNYMDNYHIRFVHKGPGGLSDAVDLSSYHTEVYDYSSLQWVYAKKSENGLDPSLLAERFRDSENPTRRVFALWWFIFPNLTCLIQPIQVKHCSTGTITF
jgi:phenylpropionate dioxygenase-like ring-hydroxylating dioxygenase large terminal subunit